VNIMRAGRGPASGAGVCFETSNYCIPARFEKILRDSYIVSVKR
jgi:hypothetical protein